MQNAMAFIPKNIINVLSYANLHLNNSVFNGEISWKLGTPIVESIVKKTWRTQIPLFIIIIALQHADTVATL